MNGLIHLAVMLLPASGRERYREQWLADLRDAPEAGVRPASIAWGAVAFALTTPHPWPSLPRLGEPARRVAFGLAFASAAVGLTHYPAVEFGWALSSAAVAAKGMVDGLVLLFQIVAGVAAVVIVTGAQDAGGRERASVWLLALASAAPLVAASGAGNPDPYPDPYAAPANLAYVAAAALVVVALVLRRTRAQGARADRRRVALVTAGLGAVAVVAYGLAASIWFSRAPLVTDFPVGSEFHAEWLAMTTSFEAHVDGVLIVSALVAVGIVAAAAIVGARRPAAEFRVAATGAGFLLLFGCLTLSQYFALALPQPGLAGASPILLTAARLALVGTVIAAVVIRRPAPAIRTSIVA